MDKNTLTALSLIATSSAISAAVVNVDINGTGSTNYSGQGAYASSGNFWNGIDPSGPLNNLSATGSNLKASDGTTVTTIDVSVFSTGEHARGSYSNNLLHDGSVHVSTIAITGLDNDKTYDLTFYSTFDNFQTKFTADGQTEGVSGAATSSPYTETFIEGMTFVTLEGVSTDGSNGINVLVSNTSTGASGANSFTFVTGLQIAVAVPEPSSSALLGLGGLALILRRRK